MIDIRLPLSLLRSILGKNVLFNLDFGLSESTTKLQLRRAPFLATTIYLVLPAERFYKMHQTRGWVKAPPPCVGVPRVRVCLQMWR